ncbi:MAG: hypothetical protein WBQ20_08265, partial [Methyloceanibacter sp.]
EQLARKVGGPPTERGEGATQSHIGANIAAALSSLDRGPANGPRVADEMEKYRPSVRLKPKGAVVKPHAVFDESTMTALLLATCSRRASVRS